MFGSTLLTRIGQMTAALVLATVNAPHSKKLGAQELAHCLIDPAAAKAKPGYMSSFFGDVEPDLQIEFGALFGLPPAAIAEAATAFAKFSGQSYPLAE
jgi:hypothetical protein